MVRPERRGGAKSLENKGNSPRGDWRMPSDAQAALWLRWADGAPVSGGP
jgi:hypothetical protein